MNDTTIEGNFIGLNPAGDAVVADSGTGIAMFNGCGGNLIGGADAAARNVISSTNNAVSLNGSDAIFQGNFIGLNAAGTARAGALFVGIEIDNASATIGGIDPGEGNVIAASTGIAFSGNPALSHSTGTVQGNFIGTDATGTTALSTGAEQASVSPTPAVSSSTTAT